MSDDKQANSGIVKTSNSLVFISHDTRDAKLAEAFSQLLKSVSAGVLKSFRTSDRRGNQGIEYGVEWYPEIIKNIQEASDVVCLLTEKSIDRPWILFEAGMAKGKLETPILGLALGISLKQASSGPFAQFQNCADDEESLTKLVFQLVDRIPNSEPDEETIRFQVGKFKKAIIEIQNNECSQSDQDLISTESIDNSSAKLFEEIKLMFQDLPSRIQNSNNRFGRHKKKNFHPMLIDEILHVSRNRKPGILIRLGFLREGMPWVYDLGIETLRIIDSKASLNVKHRSFSEFEEVIKLSTRSPLMDKYFDTKDSYMFFDEFPHMILEEMHKYLKEKQK